MEQPTIVVAGAAGTLGRRIVRALRERHACVRGLVRQGTARDRVEPLLGLGAEIVHADMSNVPDVARACAGSSCLVSALAGLRDAIVDTQAAVLEAAVEAGVPRFIPSDYSIDFSPILQDGTAISTCAGSSTHGSTRRRFARRRSTAGRSPRMLTGLMPLVLFRFRRVVYWGDADQRMDFTTRDDTAAFTASAALDPATPRSLRIAGDQVSARELKAIASEVTGTRFRLLRAGSLRTLGAFITVARIVAPGKGQLYPAWQGMQYMRDMFDGRAKLEPLDNDRYPGMRWTTAREVLAGRPR